MSVDQFHTAISKARFARYCFSCNGNERKAKKLYRANIILSEKIYAIIGIFEITLRNAIDRHFSRLKGECWLEDAVQSGGYFDMTPGCEKAFHVTQECIHKLGADYTHNSLISALTFGFWTHQFAKKEYAAAGSSLLSIFRNRPTGTKQKEIFQYLFKINEIRNRIAHYEPICFDKISGKISAARVRSRYKLMIELLTWMGYNPKKLLYGIDGVENAIWAIESI